MDQFLKAAYEEAQKGLVEGGIPIGSVLVVDGDIVGRGHNQRVQMGSPVFHAEMAALEDAGRLGSCDYKKSVLYTTLSPCHMCSGAILLYKIPKVVIGENITFRADEDWLVNHNVELEIVNDKECIAMMKAFIRNKPELWYEDIGELSDKNKGC